VGAGSWLLTSGIYKYIDDENRDPMPDELSVDFAVGKLKEKHANPFFMTIGLVKPHTPLHVPEKYFNLFPLDELALPPYQASDLLDCAPELWENGRFSGPYDFDALQKCHED